MYNLEESRNYKYVAILPAVLILSTKIIIFEIADMLILKNTRKSNSLNLDFFISVIMYVIFG